MHYDFKLTNSHCWRYFVFRSKLNQHYPKPESDLWRTERRMALWPRQLIFPADFSKMGCVLWMDVLLPSFEMFNIWSPVYQWLATWPGNSSKVWNVRMLSFDKKVWKWHVITIQVNMVCKVNAVHFHCFFLPTIVLHVHKCCFDHSLHSVNFVLFFHTWRNVEKVFKMTVILSW